MQDLMKGVAHASVSSRELYDEIIERRGVPCDEVATYEKMTAFLEGDGCKLTVRREFHISMELSVPHS